MRRPPRPADFFLDRYLRLEGGHKGRPYADFFSSLLRSDLELHPLGEGLTAAVGLLLGAGVPMLTLALPVAARNMESRLEEQPCSRGTF